MSQHSHSYKVAIHCEQHVQLVTGNDVSIQKQKASCSFMQLKHYQSQCTVTTQLFRNKLDWSNKTKVLVKSRHTNWPPHSFKLGKNAPVQCFWLFLLQSLYFTQFTPTVTNIY